MRPNRGSAIEKCADTDISPQCLTYFIAHFLPGQAKFRSVDTGPTSLSLQFARSRKWMITLP